MAGGEREFVMQVPSRKSDLGVRTASAVVMLVVVAVAWITGGFVWQVFALAVGAVCYGEFARLVVTGFATTLPRLALLVLGLIYIGLCAISLTTLSGSIVYHGEVPDGGRLIENSILLSVVGLVVCTDIGAYFAGRTIGGPKIAPCISPSKTWAGLAGGMLAAGLWGLIALRLPYWFLGYDDQTPVRYQFAAFASGAVLAIFAQVGDFAESWLKRKAGVKDSSRLIPGHGGVFDRIDGLLPIVLIYGIFGDWLIFGRWVT